MSWIWEERAQTFGVAKDALSDASHVKPNRGACYFSPQVNMLLEASTCLDTCATAWPPIFIAAGTKIVATPGAKGAFGSITRPDGSVQVTYRGKPLYFWQKDVNPGDTTGQGINGFTVATP